jgi:hypothetical protein
MRAFCLQQLRDIGVRIGGATDAGSAGIRPYAGEIRRLRRQAKACCQRQRGTDDGLSNLACLAHPATPEKSLV